IALFDNDVTPPAVGVEQLTDAAEPATAGAFRFTRSGDTSGSLTVNYTVTGTATAGTDYAALPGSVTFAAGAATADVTVTPIDDTEFEGTETVILTITPNATYDITSGSATVNILDNEVAAPAVTVSRVSDAAEPTT